MADRATRPSDDLTEESRGQEAPSRVLAYTLDHTDFAPTFEGQVTCEPTSVWLTIFIMSGIGISMVYEALHLHAGPAKCEAQFLPFLGYCGQLVAGGLWVAMWASWRKGAWSRRALVYLLLSSVGAGASQVFDYIALSHAGVQGFTILHSFVTFFACAISTLVLRTRITPLQWAGCLMVVFGLVLTGIPTPMDTEGSFAIGLASAAAGALCLAASYPLAELVFLSAPSPPAEEACCLVGSLLNVLIFGLVTATYTAPRWREVVLDPIDHAAKPSAAWAVAMYVLFTAMVGAHTLSFWKTMRVLGTVPIAISKGAMQAGTFLLAHIIFCSDDAHECISPRDASTWWARSQKVVAFVFCCLGCFAYAVSKRTPAQQARPAAATEDGTLWGASAAGDDERGLREKMLAPVADTGSVQQ